MNKADPSPEAIATRAYLKWEKEGRPTGRSEAHWIEAEHELRSDDAANRDAASSQSSERQGAPRVTNMDRALPPEERRRARAGRNKRKNATPVEDDKLEAPSHFVVTLNRAHLRIYRAKETLGPSRMQLDLEQSIDFPSGKAHYTDAETDQAGRFPHSETSRGLPGDVSSFVGGSIDERLPMQEEQERRVTDQLASQVEVFLQRHPNATWDYAAAPALHHRILKRLSNAVRGRVRVVLTKDLVNQPILEVCAQFANATAH